MVDGPDTPVRGKRFGCWKMFLIALLLLCAGYATFRIVLRMQVRARLKAIAAEGYPTTLKELDAWYPRPPEGQNAADIYQRALDAYVTDPPTIFDKLPIIGRYQLPPNGEPLPDEVRAAGAAHLASNKQAIALLQQAAGVPQCRYPLDMTQGEMTQLPHLVRSKQAARLLALDAIMHAEEGKPEDAARSVSAGLALGHSLDREPVLISHLTRVACDSTAMDALSRVLSRTELSPTTMEELSRALRKAENSDGLNRGFAAGTAAISEAIEAHPRKLFGEDPLSTRFLSGNYYARKLQVRLLMAAYTASGLKDADHKAYLDLMRKALHATKLPCEQRGASMKNVGREALALPAHHVASHVLFPSLARATEYDLQHTAILRAARTALAVEGYRQTDGKLPDKLAHLCPGHLDAVPADPFDGAPLRYKVLEKGYIVYSIGPDGKDDGGAERDPKAFPFGPPRPEDVVFRVAR